MQVRTIDASEIADWSACKDLGFLHQREDPERHAQDLLEEVVLDRTWAALDSGKVVGTLRSFSTSLTVPGLGEVLASALTNVTVAPTHRRRGLLTKMIEGDLTASAQRGEALAMLIASEYPIYGRFGFGPSVESAAYSVDTTSARFVARSLGTGEGAVEIVDAGALRKEAPALYETYRRSQPGAIGRDERWWDRRLRQVEVPGEHRSGGYCALYRSSSGEAQGYLQYQGEPKWDQMRPQGIVTVDELVALSPTSYRALWKFCCDVDLVTKVNASDRSVQEPLSWLMVDGRAVRQTMRFDFLWVRILDVAEALMARSYGCEDRMVIEVSDSMGFAAGRYALEVTGDGAHCTRTDDPPDLGLPVEVLGSVYLGGFALGTVASAGSVAELSPGAVEKADRMLRSAFPPWCSTWF